MTIPPPPKKNPKEFLSLKKTVLLFLTSLAHCCKFVLLPKLCRRVMVHPVISFTTISGKISLTANAKDVEVIKKFMDFWSFT